MTTALVRMRSATTDDVAAVRVLHERCSAQTLERRFHAPVGRISDRLARQLTVPEGGWSVLAEQGEEVVGHGCAGPLSPDQVEIGLIVDDAFQGTGIGTRLVRELARTAAERGYHSLLCEVEPDNDSVLPTVRRAGLEPVTCHVDGVLEIEVPLCGVTEQDRSA
jgi:GNAT superfamily N-acetyltransferase